MKKLFYGVTGLIMLTGFVFTVISCGSSGSPSSPLAAPTPTNTVPPYSRGAVTILSGYGINSPEGITYSSTGSYNLWFVEYKNPGTIFNASANGSGFLTSNYYANTTSFNSPSGICADANGYVYIADLNNNQVEVTNVVGSSSSTITGLTGAESVALNSAGTTLFVGLATSPVTIAAYSITGSSYPKTYTLLGMTQTALGGITSIATDSNGNLYVASSGVSILKYSPTVGSPSTFIPAASGFSPSFMAFDSSGNLFVTENNFLSSQWVQEYTSAGSASVSIGSSLFSALEGIAIDPSGDLFLADSGNNVILEVQK